MQEYNEFDDEHEGEEEPEVHHFCKLTFGQFFTLMVLEIITLCFVFYLGARYGNEYLKLDVISESRQAPVQIISEPRQIVEREDVKKEKALGEMSDDELRDMARKALGEGKPDLKQRVEGILARQQEPSSAPPMGEPSYDDHTYQPQGQAAQLPVNGEQQPRVQQFVPGPREAAPEAQGVVRVKSGQGGQFSVQVGAYPDVKEASYRVEEWKAKGYPAFMMIADLGEKGHWYRVRIGGFGSEGEAGTYLEDIAQKEGVADAFVVRNEQ